ncbi:MAG: hypothetical protein SVW57_13790, partial [Thermodesulfobacteriota bacterium]|nr:hypothetical protein [Thermodesulfobacteriota bacterium]
APSIVEDAIKKEVNCVHFFTSGFAEVATEEGIALQKKIVDLVKGKIRLIGPNCMGIYNPKMKIAFDQRQSSTIGNAGFVSQSGGLAIMFSENGEQEGNYCSKVISIGNSCDLKLTDFLEYFSEDEETKTIGMYIEGLGDNEGEKFIDILRRTTRRKPVLIWKSGQTEAGARAASSHTGAMASGYQMWQTLAKQFGVILVDSIEEMHDFIKLYRMIPPPKSTKSCIVALGGGNSVTFTDVCAKGGIELDELQKETQEGLLEFIPPMGTIRRNPVDLSGGAYGPNVVENSLKLIGRDKNIDSVIFIFEARFMVNRADRFGGDPQKIVDNQVAGIVAARDELKVPLVCNNPIVIEDMAVEELRQYLKKELENNNVPSFRTIERTIKALRRYNEYYNFLNGY